MFANNVFRNIITPPTTSFTSHEDEINQDHMWEFRQLYPVYVVFMAFLSLKHFDGEKLEPYVGKTFIDGLMRRLNDSCMEAERELAKCILLKLFERALYTRKCIAQGTVASLENCDGNDRVTSIVNEAEKELLEIFDVTMRHGLVESITITKVLAPLMKRRGLNHYAGRLHECFMTATRYVAADLAKTFVEYLVSNWSASAADVPSLCRTLSSLYFDVCGPEWRRLVRGLVVGHAAGRTTAVAADADAADCQAYLELCGRLVDDAADGLVAALMAVYRNHWDYGCVKRADRLLRRLVGVQRIICDVCRLDVLQSLVDDRLRKMADRRLIDDASRSNVKFYSIKNDLGR